MKKRTGVLDGPKIKKLQRVNNQPVGDGALDVPKTNDYRKQKRATNGRPYGKTIKFIVGATIGRPLLTIIANKGGRTQFAPTENDKITL